MKRLLAVLANPPLGSGARTRNRLELARVLTGCDSVTIANLLDVPTSGTDAIGRVGVSRSSWLDSRVGLTRGLDGADVVLLGYGVTRPTGVAGLHQREQCRWLQGRLLKLEVPVFAVGMPPRHPSRWQRLTSSQRPSEPFETALAHFLLPTDLSSLQLG